MSDLLEHLHVAENHTMKEDTFVSQMAEAGEVYYQAVVAVDMNIPLQDPMDIPNIEDLNKNMIQVQEDIQSYFEVDSILHFLLAA